MGSLSLAQLKQIGIKPLIVFFSGSLFIALFPILFVYIFGATDVVRDVFVSEGYWKGVPPIVGSWIGGSTSQLVLKELVRCPETIFLVILVMDTVLVNVWTIFMFQGIKRSAALNRLLQIGDRELPLDISMKNNRPLHPAFCSFLLLGLVLFSNAFISTFIVKVVVLSFLGLLLGNVLPRWNTNFVLKAGGLLIILVMAILGLKLRFDGFQLHLPFLGFLLIWLIGHFIFMVVIAKVLNVNMAWVPIASMANVGGIATAPAVTAAYNKKWMPHAIVLAILSMVTGTFWGMITIAGLGVVLGIAD